MRSSVLLPWTLWTIVVVAQLTVRSSSAADIHCRDVDVLFVIDHSGSISDNEELSVSNWNYIIDALVDVVRATARYATVRYAAISYGTTAQLEFNLDRYTGTLELIIALRNIRNSGGNTNTTGALRLSRTEVWSSLANRPATYDVLVLITDGVPSLYFEAEGLVPEADRVKALGVRLIGIGVSTAVNDALMMRIVSQPASENYFRLANFSQLTGIVETLLQCITGTPITPTTPTTVSTTTRRIDPTTAFIPGVCHHQADIVIVLDASGGRMNFEQFRAVRLFLVDMLTELRAVIETGAVRVGMVRFADSAMYTFNLNTFQRNFAGLIEAVRTAEYIGGGTNTGIGASTYTILIIMILVI